MMTLRDELHSPASSTAEDGMHVEMEELMNSSEDQTPPFELNDEETRWRKAVETVASVVAPKARKLTTDDWVEDEEWLYVHAYSCCPPPIFILGLTFLQVGIFLYYTLSMGIRPGWFRGCGGCYDVRGEIGPLVFLPYKRKEAWRFFSYTLVHAGLEHLLVNMVVQVLLGIPLELVHKIWRIGPIYIAGVLLGSLSGASGPSTLPASSLVCVLLDKDGDGRVTLVEMQGLMDSDLSEEQKAQILRDHHDGPRRHPSDLEAVETRWHHGVMEKVARVVAPQPALSARARAASLEGQEVTDAAGDYVRAYSCCPPPVFILCITLIEVGIFLYYTLAMGIRPGWFRGCGGCYKEGGGVGPLVFLPSKREEAWRFISYMLVHSGLEHLLGNVVVQVMLGTPLELVHQIWRIGPIYLAGVLLGSLLQYVLDSTVILVGASGGVYALITAHLANVILVSLMRNWAEMPFRWGRLGLAGAFVGLDVGHVLYRRLYLAQCDRISYTAHIGGAAAGFFLGLGLLRNLFPTKWERVVQWVALGVFLVILVVTVLLTVFIPPGTIVWTTKCTA